MAMQSMRHRFCDILTSTVSALILTALFTAASTIFRDLVLHPRPVVSNVRVTSFTPLYHVRRPTLLSPEVPDASIYYRPGSGSDGHRTSEKQLSPNIVLVDTADRPGDSEEDRKRKAWQRQHVPQGFKLGIRTIDRVVLYLSGSVDFSPCWDWNTKAIYASFVARFSSKTASQNDVVLLDAVLRPVSLSEQLARLAELRRQERSAALPGSGSERTAAAAAGAPADATQMLTDAERQQLAAFEETLRSNDHDHPSIHIDHIDKRLVLNESFKYYVDAFDDVSLGGNTVEVVLRYQVMSYSGWAPVREDALGHQVKVRMPENALQWKLQERW
ncbi:putative Signal peptidase subunit [Leishmania naiffi]|uniref:Signal peptidase complex subunit 3 n=1 Tax=Leishmania naiffi TaxID=5678 RepID=A0AAW3BY35_9TRYP